MSTINGVGTMRYDWSHFPDGTAEATLWFVVGFFPLIPLKRQQVQVISDSVEPSTIAKAAMATTAYGEGFRSGILVLGNVPMNTARVLRTYFLRMGSYTSDSIYVTSCYSFNSSLAS